MASGNDLNEAMERIHLRDDGNKLYNEGVYGAAMETFEKLFSLQEHDSEKLETLLLQAKCGARLGELESYKEKVYNYIVLREMNPKITLQQVNSLKQHPIAVMVLCSSVSKMYKNEADAAEEILRCLSKICDSMNEEIRQTPDKLVISIGFQLLEQMIERLVALDTDGIILKVVDKVGTVAMGMRDKAMPELQLEMSQKLLKVLEKKFGEGCDHYMMYGMIQHEAGCALLRLDQKAEAARRFHKSVINVSKAKQYPENLRRAVMENFKFDLYEIVGV